MAILAGSLITGAISASGQASAASSAAEAQERAAQTGIEEQRRQFDISQEQFAPARERGELAGQQQAALLGLSGVPAQQEAFQAFQESPGQAFLRQRSEQSLLRNQAAIGGLGGGNVRSALQQQGIGFAQQDLQNQLQRLAGVAGQGQALTSNLAGLGANQAANVANLQGQAGQARAGGILGAAAPLSQFAGQVGGGLLAGGLTGGFSQPTINQQTGTIRL